MKTESRSVVTTNSPKTKNLIQEFNVLEIDHKIFQDTGKYFDSRRFSASGSKSITQLFKKSPRTLMSSLQDRGYPVERETICLKGRSLLGDFEGAAKDMGSVYDGEIEDCGSGKSGSWSSSCLSDEKFGGELLVDLKIQRDECRRGLVFNEIFVGIGLMAILFGILYVICNGGMFADEEMMLLPT